MKGLAFDELIEKSEENLKNIKIFSNNIDINTKSVLK